MENGLQKREIVFWDVDTQKDFMLPEGKLYVKDAEKIIPNLAKLTSYAKQKGIMIIASKDMHTKDDPELEENGGAFPRHCMAGEEGSDKIGETRMEDPVIIENKLYTAEKLKELLEKDGEIIIEKQTFSVFDNPNTRNIIKMLGIEKAVVYGVATDYCVKATVDGLNLMGVDVIIITDAITAVKRADGLKALEEMRQKGAIQMTTDEVMETY
jgi:nicotinamidase/pyrazinamidase